MSGEKVLSARLEIEALDKTGQIFGNIGKKMAALSRLQKQMDIANKIDSGGRQMKQQQAMEKQVQTIDRMSQSMKHYADMEKLLDNGAFTRLASDIDRAAIASDRSAQRIGQSMRKQTEDVSKLSSALKEMGHVAALGAGLATHYSVEKAAELQHVTVNAINANISQDEIDKAAAITRKTAAGGVAVTTSDGIEVYHELVGALAKAEEAPELLALTLKAKDALSSMGAVNSPRDMQSLVVAAENFNRTKDPEKFTQYMNAMVASMSVMGSQITPADIQQAATGMGLTGKDLNDRFIGGILPTVIMEMGGGAQAGAGLANMQRQLQGGLKNNKDGAGLLHRLGLFDNESDFIRDKKGKITGFGGNVKNDELRRSDPSAWLNDVFKPALVAHGYSSSADISKAIATIFTDPTGQNTAGLLMDPVKLATMLKNEKRFGNVPTVDQIVENNKNDPVHAMTMMSDAMNNFAADMSKPVMADAAAMMHSIGAAINSWAESLSAWQKANPDLAKGVAGGAIIAGGTAGAIGAGHFISKILEMFTGSSGALNGSAAALTQAAGALEAAAGAIAGENLPGGVPKKVGEAMKVSPVLLGGVIGGVVAGGVGISMSQAGFMDTETGKSYGSQIVTNPMIGAVSGNDALAAVINDPSLTTDADEAKKRYWDDQQVRQDKHAEIRRRLQGLGPMIDSGGGYPLPPSSGLGTGAAENIRQAISGQANVQIEVKPSADFMTRIMGIIKREMAAFTVTGPGSTGHSDP